MVPIVDNDGDDDSDLRCRGTDVVTMMLVVVPLYVVLVVLQCVTGDL